MAIVSADKQGFLRSETSLVQTIGRAARHVNGTAILYADGQQLTPAMRNAIRETERRRRIQIEYNARYNLSPQNAGTRATAQARPANPILAMLQSDAKLKLRSEIGSLTTSQQQRYELLEMWRTSAARIAGLPPYRVARDAVLVAIAKASPSDAKGLRAVRGVGPKMMMSYGESILQCLAAGRTFLEDGLAAPAEGMAERIHHGMRNGNGQQPGHGVVRAGFDFSMVVETGGGTH